MTTTVHTAPTAAAVATEPLMDWEYELLAGADTAEGYTAWNDGDYSRAVQLWQSAARWSRLAETTESEAAR